MKELRGSPIRGTQTHDRGGGDTTEEKRKRMGMYSDWGQILEWGVKEGKIRDAQGT